MACARRAVKDGFVCLTRYLSSGSAIDGDERMLSPALSCLVMSIQTMRDLLGHSPTSPDLAAFLSALSSPIATPDVKSYPDAVYFNYYSLGLSLLFLPIDGYKPRSEISHLALDGIDVYNDLFSVKPDDKKGLRSP